MAIADGGKVVDDSAFLRRIFSRYPWQEVGNGCGGCRAGERKGCLSTSPLLHFLAAVTLPALRITARGLVNAKERRIVPLFAD
jgi:adenine deaminase